MAEKRSYEDYIKEIDQKAEDLVQQLVKYILDFEESYIRKKILHAYEYAKEAHK